MKNQLLESEKYIDKRKSLINTERKKPESKKVSGSKFKLPIDTATEPLRSSRN